MKRNRYIRYIATAMAVTSVAACSLIDEDLDDCNNEYLIEYELRLITNLTTELTTQLNTELSTEVDTKLATALQEHLKDIFTDRAHDLDLSFFDVVGDSAILHHMTDTIDASQTSYTLFIPARKYMHTAVANVVNNKDISVSNNEYCHKGSLKQVEKDTIDSHTTGLFTARLPMDILEGQDQTFNVHLYMANCAMAIVIDTTGINASKIEIFTSGFATDYHIADSIYTYDRANETIVRTQEIKVDEGSKVCFYSVNYPSPEEPLGNVKRRTRSVIETTEPFISPEADDALWAIHCYVTAQDGSIAQTMLFVKSTLRAGQFKIIKAYIDPNGVVRTNDTEIATSVVLQWENGLVIDNPAPQRNARY